MNSSKPEGTERAGSFEIDYDRVNVADIMARIQKAAAEAPATEVREDAFPGRAAFSPEHGNGIPPQGLKQKIKMLAAKLLRPFFPVLRLLGLPILDELRAAIQSLHETNVNVNKCELRLDLLEGRLKDLDQSMVYIQLLHNLDHNLVVELTKLKIETDTLKSKLGILEKDQEFLQKREKALEEKALK